MKDRARKSPLENEAVTNLAPDYEIITVSKKTQGNHDCQTRTVTNTPMAQGREVESKKLARETHLVK